jgi:AcrR family transcriptional regulator
MVNGMEMQERRRHLRQEILYAARELFVREEVQSTSIRKIAQPIEYARTTVYLYFKNKFEILAHTLRRDRLQTHPETGNDQRRLQEHAGLVVPWATDLREVP